MLDRCAHIYFGKEGEEKVKVVILNDSTIGGLQAKINSNISSMESLGKVLQDVKLQVLKISDDLLGFYAVLLFKV